MIKVIELFAGIGSQHSALKRLGIDFEVIGIAEIDKYAIKSYEAIHGKVHNYGDISKIERLDPADFWTYSFPCQDLSVAGKQKGLGEGTRSGLLYEVERLLDVAKENNELPKYLMLENVKNLVGKKFKGDFDRWIGKLNQLGYNTYWKVLNAKHYGVPQNRERVFAISIRKDVDNGYQFPEPFESDIRLKDVLEKEVDEKFYISNEKAKRLVSHVAEREPLPHGNNPVDGTINNPKVKDVSNCIKARYDMGVSNLKSDGTMVIKVGNTSPSGKSQCNDVIHPNGVYSTICAGNHGNANPSIVDDMYKSREPREYAEEAPTLRSERSGLKVKIPQATTNGEIVPTLTAASQDIMYVEPCIVASRGRNPNNPSDRTPGIPMQQRLEVNKNGVSNTITSVQKDNYVLEPNVLSPKRTEYGKAIRKDYESGKINESRHNMTSMEPRNDGICNTLTTVQKDNYVLEPSGLYLNQSEAFTRKPLNGISRTLKANQHDSGVIDRFRIRKLTPKECFRLMGFTDEEFHKAEAVNSNSQLYKQAGNSIVVDVLYYLFKNLFFETDGEGYYEQIRMEVGI